METKCFDMEFACIKDKEIAKMTGINLCTLRNWRSRGIGPKFIKIGGKRGSVLYPLKEFRDWWDTIKK